MGGEIQNTSQDLTKILNSSIPLLAAYVEQSQRGTEKILLLKDPQLIVEELQLQKVYSASAKPFDIDKLVSFLKAYLDNSQHMHHPAYIGHQVAVPHFGSSLADLIYGVINNPMSIFEMGPSAAVIEATIVNWMLSKVGWLAKGDITKLKKEPGKAAGVLTHGGSFANLHAMLAARANVDPNAWEKGIDPDLIVLAPTACHYSLSRAISILGLGQDSIWPVKVDENEVMCTDDLRKNIREARRRDKKIMAVVANACATSTGLFDPIDEIGKICEHEKVWFHVDAAHGASVLLSKRHKSLLAGIQRADSMIWDAHKMLRTTALCAAVLFKDFQKMIPSFYQKGSYLFHEKEHRHMDIMPFQLECTKAALGLKLFLVLAIEGEHGIAAFINTVFANTRLFYKPINDREDFYCPYQPQSNILCFRYTNDDSIQLKIRNELTKKGNFYISSTEIHGKRYLRLAVMNPLTDLVVINNLLDEIETIGKKMD